MKKEKISQDELNAVFDQLLEDVADARIPLLQKLANRKEKRAKRLTKIKTRIKEDLGEDHPRVIALGQAAENADQLKDSINAVVVRESRRPKVGAEEWMVFGSVIDALGKPAPGLRVRVYDKDRKYDDLLGVTTTDEYGDFYIKYHERMFREVGEGLPELYVMVENRRGKLLYSSKDSVRRSAGKASYFKIVLKK